LIRPSRYTFSIYSFVTERGVSRVRVEQNLP
jgi:hypothetical protein